MGEVLQAVVVGCGWAGQIHAETYASLPGVRLVALCDPAFAKAQQLADRLGCRAYPSLEALLDRQPVDIASLASPIDCHVPQGKQLLEVGAAVFSEKPLGRDAIQASELVRMARDRGLSIGVNYNRRFADGYRLAHQRLEGAGSIRFLSSILAQNVPLAQTPELRAGLPDDFLVFGALSHSLDLVCWLAGEPVGMHALGSRQVPGQLWTDLLVSLELPGGALGSIICSLAGPEWGQLPIERTELATDAERILVDNITGRVEWFGYRDTAQHTWTPSIFEPSGYVESMRRSLAAWVESVRQGAPEPIPGEDGVRAVRLCEQVRDHLAAQEKANP